MSRLRISILGMLSALAPTLAWSSDNTASAQLPAASPVKPDFRVAQGVSKFDDTLLYAVAYELRPLHGLRARHFELAMGLISNSARPRPFVSLGPVWRLPLRDDSLFLEFGLSPTLLGGSSFGGRDLGGNFHFTSSASIGATLGRFDNVSVSLRVQHTSNGGLSSTNPGLDMVGLNFTFNVPLNAHSHGEDHDAIGK